MFVTIESAIVHVFNQADGYPIFSDIPIALDAEFETYLSATIQKTFFSDDTKSCIFQSESNIWQRCNDISWDIISVSKSIAKEVFIIMRRNKEIPQADLLFGTACISGHHYFYMLKLDYRNAPTHFVSTKDGKVAISIIQHRTLFSVPAAKLKEGFFIDIETPLVKIVEKKYLVDGIKDFYLSTQILGCTENKTTRQKANKVLQVAEKVASLYYPDSKEIYLRFLKSYNYTPTKRETRIVSLFYYLCTLPQHAKKRGGRRAFSLPPCAISPFESPLV